MRNGKKNLTGLFPFLLVICNSLAVMPSQAHAASPMSQALSSASMTASQELSAATAHAVSEAITPAITPATAHALAPVPPQAAEALLPLKEVPAKSLQDDTSEPFLAADMQPKPVEKRTYDTRRTLFVEVAQRKLRLEAPLKMCFLDRTVPMQEGIYLLLSSLTERRGDQVLLGVFMQCDNITSPSGWLNGMPDAGFVTWMNPSIGETSTMSRADYLDMREASFPKYAKGRDIGAKPDKAVHRNENAVALAFTDDAPGQDGTKQNSTSIIATTLLRHIPVEITLHLTGNADTNKEAPKFPEAYATMDELIAQQITLNE